MNELIKTAKKTLIEYWKVGLKYYLTVLYMKNLKKILSWHKKYSKPDNTAIDYASVLSAGNSYKLGKFQIILDEDTGNLKVYVHTNSDHMQITPKSDNSVVIHACR